MTTMNRLAAAFACLAALATLASPALAATTTTVVDVPFGADGDSQRFLFVAPDAPKAIVVSVPGGDGIMGIQDDGTMTTRVAACTPVSRVRQALADRGYAVALVDATRNGTVRNAAGILEAIRWARARHAVPVWVVGGSAATVAVTNMGATLPPDIPGGIIYNSPDRPNAQVAQVRRHAQVVYHTLDTLAFGNLMYNALTGAVVRERVALSGGTNANCTYHGFNGLDAAYLDTTTTFMDKYTAATLATATPNVQGLWWKSPAGSESGWGVNLTQQGDILFATWFTYDTDGRGLWLVMPAGAKGAGNSWSGTLYRTTGPAFNAVPFNPAQVVATEVGTATFTFTDGDNGTFAWVVNGVSQSKPITRQVFSPTQPACAVGGAAGSSPNYRALWWTPGGAESGWGLNVDHQGDILFATWFTYDADGRGLWLVAPALVRTGSGYAGALYRTTGPAFSANPWNGGAVVATEVGTASLAFADADTGTFTYTYAGVTQSKPITRQAFATPATVCRN
ncbi:MAG: hypothetical protein KF738_01900 [Burkholderiales bacterium]|nr:hypothetical protein [Burkholderiales bacterium]